MRGRCPSRLFAWACAVALCSAGISRASNENDSALWLSASPVEADADPLTHAYGAELELGSARVPALKSTLGLQWSDVDAERGFVGEGTSPDPSRPTRHYEIGVSSDYSPTDWLTFDAALSWTHGRFRDRDPEGSRVPGTPDLAISTGLSLHDLGGFFGAIGARYFGSMPLAEDDSVRSDPTFLVAGRMGYRVDETWTLTLEAFSQLSSTNRDISHFYASRVHNAAPSAQEGGYGDPRFYPLEPASIRLSLDARF